MIEGVELLSPVGSWEALMAAVQNGADAVYLGGKLFNARHYASNFSDEELMEAVSYAHLRGVRVFVTVNILIDDSEIEKALDYVYLLHSIGVDAIIVQDIGFA
ncbi:MAG: U32 family peptidase, partial [Gudongella sp.]|nr:U32 family peptidase [Gudongella sp.]